MNIKNNRLSLAISSLFISCAPVTLTLLAALLLNLLAISVRAQTQPKAIAQDGKTMLMLDASQPPPRMLTGHLKLGGANPAGRVIDVTGRFLTLDGKPWFPVMGEFHFTRYPAEFWEEELLKMKAGGIQVVATYLFWIHHEELEGQFDWSGRRDLRRFLELCAKHNLLALVRCGPWSHGECRHGGFPYWLLVKNCSLRRNDPVYLSYVSRYFGQVGAQLKGLLWKDGGPVVGIQFENEYYIDGPDAGAAHMQKLKELASKAGIVAPLYTVTGWGKPHFPPEEFIPVFGQYPDQCWGPELTDYPMFPGYLFGPARNDPTIGNDLFQTQGGGASDAFRYPYATCEMGGGMQVTYQRRPLIEADDVAALNLTRLACGVTMQGYYMYHGGSHPEGRLTTMQESQRSGYPSDYPVVSYDYQAPLGDFGQTAPSYHKLKRMHLLIADFGEQLAPMVTVLPNQQPARGEDTTTVRAAGRFEGDRGFLFVNNYQRLLPLPAKHDVQFQLKLPTETIVLPHVPLTIPAGSYFVWPVNLDLGALHLKYATAQLLCRVTHKGVPHFFFFPQDNVAPEFVFSRDEIDAIKLPAGARQSANGPLVTVSGLTPGTDCVLTVRARSGQVARLVLLTDEQSLQCYRAVVAGAERVILSPADLLIEPQRLRLRSRDPLQLTCAIFPPLSKPPATATGTMSDTPDGIFGRYHASVARKQLTITCEQLREPRLVPPVKKGPRAALAPEDADFFFQAGAWRVTLPPNAMTGLSDVFLHVDYVGDVARAYLDGHLMTDHFYHGQRWEIGLKRFAPEVFQKCVELQIMPLRKDAPIYLDKRVWPQFPPTGQITELRGVTAIPEYEVTCEMNRGK